MRRKLSAGHACKDLAVNRDALTRILFPDEKMANYLLLILTLLLVCCGKTNDPKKEEGRISYADIIDVKYRGVTAEKIKSMLGEPDIVNQAKGSEVWHYGPNLDAMFEGGDGAIVGVTVSFDEQGKVRAIIPTRKSK